MINIETKCINFFKTIKWEEVGVGEDYEKYRGLLYEFFRRAAIFSKLHNINRNEPWQIIRSVLPDDYWLSPDAENVIKSFADKRSIGIGIYIALANFTLFEKAREIGIFGKNEKNIYSPLVKIYDLKGEFHSHHGFTAFSDLSQIYIVDGSWVSYEKDEPYIEFDEYF